MATPNLSLWHREGYVIVSPRFANAKALKECQKFFIRAHVDVECDEKALFIRIDIGDKKGKQNRATLQQLGLIK